MADLKISALPAATTPVGGTEVLPIVQSSTTKKVSIDNLTKGRVVNALTFDTDVAAAGVTLTGTTLAADGTDANIPINVTPKGTGTVVVSSSGLTVNGTTPSILSNDGIGLVITQSGTDKVKIRNVGSLGENTSFQIGEGNSAAQPNITFINDSDTGLYNNSLTPNRLSLVAGGAEYVGISTSETVVNDAGGNYDFRVEGDSDANLLFVDASTDRIGLGTATPGYKLDVNGTGNFANTVTLTGGTANGVLYLDGSKGITSGSVLSYNGTTFSADTAVVINDSGADKDFRVEGDTQPNLFICDASTDRIGSGIAAPGANVDFRAATQHTLRIGTTATSGVAANFANIEYYWSDEDAAGVKIELKADMVGNVGPGGGAATDFVINTYGIPAFALATAARFTSNQEVVFPGVYDDTVGATNRDLYIDDTGKIGYVSSIRASKTNIADLNSPSWLLQLNPVSFNYRKKDEEGKFTDEAETPLEYGLIAEDAEAVNPELCFYDIVEGKPELRGVHYSKLVTPILKLVQEQQKAIESLQAEIAALKSSR